MSYVEITDAEISESFYSIHLERLEEKLRDSRAETRELKGQVAYYRQILESPQGMAAVAIRGNARDSGIALGYAIAELEQCLSNLKQTADKIQEVHP